mgnify:CR=1 FL=1|jgi:hypothetical protein
MINVSILGVSKTDPQLNTLRKELLTINGHSFSFPDLTGTKDLNEYYEIVKQDIIKSDYIILLNDHKETTNFKVLLGMAFQSEKKLKITSINRLKQFIENKGIKVKEL